MGIYNKKNQQKKTQRMKTPTPTKAVEDHQEEDEGSHAVAVSAEAATTLTLAPSTGAAAGALSRPAPRTMQQMISDGKYRNKRRCLVLCLRGATARYRHVLEDLRTLIPHHKKESKLDVSGGKAGAAAAAINDIAAMNNCTSVLFLECRKQQDGTLLLIQGQT